MTNILIVDDSPTVLTSMRQTISRGGYTVEDCRSGEDAMKKLKTGYRPDLIITDLNMDGMDGIEFIQHARKNGGCRFTPILVLTTESSQDQRDRAKTAGATGWLVKPVEPEKLFAVLDQVLPT
ncbi:Chemotaxis regulator - transmits chemoreceptor signals to flagelllar motor components CheY [Rhodovulum sp. P5]|uniref:response regulator n=1 Tax=Rhodovulum sp. P5 TaxID=1564506 RepID=UPI0009C3C0B5|nr:response regulator [Rhodovulum sp. P5]ARE40325.1 Chemotaxis regulator - transmits chemoreceptor signals to flagelllar motor components CheY [Rhodovulum sp. P5]